MSSRGWRTAPTAVALLALLGLPAPPALADDLLILDPENPAVSTPGHPDDGPAQPPRTDARDGEQDDGEQNDGETRDDGDLELLFILDPENPGTSAPTSGAGATPSPSGETEDGLTIDDPENVPGTPAPPSHTPAGPVSRATTPPPPAATTTLWRGQYSGRLSSDFRRDHAGEETLESLQEVSMRLRHRTTAGRTVQVEGRLSWWVWGGGNQKGAPWNVDETRAELDAELRSAFVAGHVGPWLVRVGQQTVVWGSSDLLRFADVLHARDLRRGLAFSAADARIPAPGVLLTRPFDRTTLQLVWMPFFVPDRIPTFGTRWAALRGDPPLVGVPEIAPAVDGLVDPSVREPLSQALLTTERPRATPENSTVGARLTRSGPGWDGSLSYVYGWDRVPAFSALPGVGLAGDLVGSLDLLDRLRGAVNEDELDELLERLEELLDALENGRLPGGGGLPPGFGGGPGGLPPGAFPPRPRAQEDPSASRASSDRDSEPVPSGSGEVETPVDPREALAALAEGLEALQGFGPLFASRYTRRHFLMADGVRYTGELGWRSEVVFSPQRTVTLADLRAVRRPSLAGTLGVGREGDGEGVVVSLEGFAEGWFPEEGDTPGALFPRLDYGGAAGLQFPLSRREGRTTLRGTAGGLVAVERGVLALTPQLSWRPTDGHTIDLGAVWFLPLQGRDGGPGDALRSASHAYVGWQTSF